MIHKDKSLNIWQSVLLLILIIGAVATCVTLKTGGPMIGLFFSWVLVYIFCVLCKIDYEDVMTGAYDAIRVVVPTIILLMAIGVMIGTWILSGTIPTIIVFGLEMINPTYLLPLALIFCALLSLVTGTSYGSVGSAGIAMVAIGNAMGIHPGMVAGAVICGAMFGDKLSPLSDTTNLAPAVSGAMLGKHIKSMLWTTIPPFIISLIIFTMLGFIQGGEVGVSTNTEMYVDALNSEFIIGVGTLLPAIILIILLVLKVPAIVCLGLSSLVAGLIAVFAQGSTVKAAITVAYNGYFTNIDIPTLQSILNRGGMSSMLQTVAILSFAVGMGGMLDKLGVLAHILSFFTKRIKSNGSLIVSTLLVGYTTSMMSCSSPMSHVLTGRMMGPLFKERGIAPEILSRTIEDSGTLGGPMIPWHGYFIYMSATLGVTWTVVFPYLFLLYLTPVFSIIYGFTGISILKVEAE